MHLERKDVVRTGALATIQLQTILLVEAPGPAVLSAYPDREEPVASGTGMIDRRLHQRLSHPRPCTPSVT
jgi:hypothetical protein